MKVKERLRKEILELRKNLKPADVEYKSRQITKRILDLEYFRNVGVVMTYVAFRNEIRTEEIIKYCLNTGKRLVVPKVVKKRRLLLASEIQNYPEDLAPGTLNIMEPKEEVLRPVPVEIIDFLIVPGLAFDRLGNRLGYGGGYYDCFIPSLRPDVVTAAPVYDFQIRDDVFSEKHDIPVDLLITENKIIDCKRYRKEIFKKVQSDLEIS